MSRAQWLALGSSAALLACSAQIELTPPTERDAARIPDSPEPARGLDSGHTACDGSSAGADAGLAGIDADFADADAGCVEVDSGYVDVDAGFVQIVDAGLVEASGFACPSRSGYFACGGGVCDRSIQACVMGVCEWYQDIVILWGVQACGPCPTCDCLAPPGSPCVCTEDDAGTVTILSCGGCYGAPPVRLERIA
jgi:hypothetical protein